MATRGSPKGSVLTVTLTLTLAVTLSVIVSLTLILTRGSPKGSVHGLRLDRSRILRGVWSNSHAAGQRPWAGCLDAAHENY